MKYTDILISGDDIALDVDGLPLFVADEKSIVQDIQHMIRESGYLLNLVAERSQEMRQLWLQKIINLVEEDLRIVPGTVTMELASPIVANNGTWNLLAETYEFGVTDAITLTTN